jgi:hypothetical protein
LEPIATGSDADYQTHRNELLAVEKLLAGYL